MGDCGQQHQEEKVTLYLVWTELQFVSGETVTETQGHWCQVLACQPTATSGTAYQYTYPALFETGRREKAADLEKLSK